MTPAGRAFARLLTPTQARVLLAVCGGLYATYSEIARELGTKEQVIKNYLRPLYLASGAERRLGLAVWCWRNGVLTARCPRCESEDGGGKCLRP